MITTRRRLTVFLGSLAAVLCLGAAAPAQDAPKEFRVGYQKIGLLVVARPLSDEILTAQQTTADRFFRLGLIPRPIKVRDIVWSPPRT